MRPPVYWTSKMRLKKASKVAAALLILVCSLIGWHCAKLTSSPSGHFISDRLVGDESVFHFANGELLLELVGDEERFKIGNYYQEADGAWVVRFSVGQKGRWRITPRLLSLEVRNYAASNRTESLQRKWFDLNWQSARNPPLDGNVLYSTNQAFRKNPM